MESLSKDQKSNVLTGSVIRFGLSTVPFLVVLIYFLFKASQRGLYTYNNYSNQNVEEEEEPLMSLMDIMVVFLSFHVLWTMFTIYIVIFIPKRRRFLGRYLNPEYGPESTLGDIIYDRPTTTNTKFSTNTCWNCFNRFILLRNLQEYGYAIYPHPEFPQQKVVRKKVRVYQQYTRERTTIVTLPNRPLSGQSKMDIEIDLSMMQKERDQTLRRITIISMFWILFSLFGAIYCMIQMVWLSSHNGLLIGDENAELGKKVCLVVIGCNIPFGLLFNWIRFIMWKNWMMNRGAIIENEKDARKIHNSCLFNAPSEDGSDTIPYSILGGTEDQSYAGTLPSHSSTAMAAKGGKQSSNAKVMASPSSEDQEDTTDNKKWASLL